jgi:hypothetical protein
MAGDAARLFSVGDKAGFVKNIVTATYGITSVLTMSLNLPV